MLETAGPAVLKATRHKRGSTCQSYRGGGEDTNKGGPCPGRDGVLPESLAAGLAKVATVSE